MVMGNEACDLDSTVSALALAYFLAQVRLGHCPGDCGWPGGRPPMGVTPLGVTPTAADLPGSQSRRLCAGAEHPPRRLRAADGDDVPAAGSGRPGLLPHLSG